MTSQRWVVDASFCGSLLLPDEHSERALALIGLARSGVAELHTTALWWHEMANLLVSAVRRNRIDQAALTGAWTLLEALPLKTKRDEGAWSALTSLAVDSGLTAYDAGYLALAIELNAGLATEDKQLRKAATQRNVPVWEGRR